MKAFLQRSLILFVLIAGTLGLLHLVDAPVKATLGSGAYTTVPYDSANFGATQAMTFSVGTQVTYRYNVDLNNQMHLYFDVMNSSTTGTPASSFITVKIPEGRTAQRTVTTTGLMATDNGAAGVWELCYVLISQNSNVVQIRRASGANWPVISNSLRIDANLVLKFPTLRKIPLTPASEGYRIPLAGGPLQIGHLIGAPTQSGMGPQRFTFTGNPLRGWGALNRDIDWALKQDAPPSCKHVLFVLANRADKNHQCFPSLASISADTGLNRATVTRCITQLLELKLLIRTKRGIDSNLYTLPVGAPRDYQPAQGATTNKRSVGAPRSTGRRTMQPPVGAPCATEPKLETKGTQIGDIPPPEKPDRKSKAPATYEVTENHRIWAKEEGITSNLEMETRKFLDHFKGNGEKKVNWDSTWRNWMRNSMIYNRRGGNGNGNHTSRPDENIAAANRVISRLHPENSGSDERDVTGSQPGDLFGSPLKPHA